MRTNGEGRFNDDELASGAYLVITLAPGDYRLEAHGISYEA